MYRVGEKDVLTDAEAGAILDVSRQTIRNWRLSGRLPAQRKGRGWAYPYRDVVDMYVARGGKITSLFLVG